LSVKKEVRNVTVAMSDHDYGVLVEAAGWIEYHAGKDAPEYPHLPRLSGVVDNIAKRRIRDYSKDPQTAVPQGGAIIHLRRATRDHPSSGKVA
jgi:hypothetical protein